MTAITTELLSKTYDLLVAQCGASNIGNEKDRFVEHFSRVNPPREYRFIGDLEFGGKFRFPRFSVDCYPEDETPERLAMISSANKQLKELVKNLAPQLDVN